MSLKVEAPVKEPKGKPPVRVLPLQKGGKGSLRGRFRRELESWGGTFGTKPHSRSYYILGALLIVLGMLFYIQFSLIGRMREEARAASRQYAFFYRLAAADYVEDNQDLDFIFETLSKPQFPVIVTDQKGEPIQANVPGIAYGDSIDMVSLMQKKEEMDESNEPVAFEVPGHGTWMLHYGDSTLIRRLSSLPFLAIGVIALCITVGYIGYRNIRDNETHSIWVGMTKETAHQLGTPLSSLYGWLELMRERQSTTTDHEENARRLSKIIDEMDRDLGRLNKVVSRFSQIGSVPELRSEDLNAVIAETVGYLGARFPRLGEEIRMVENYSKLPRVPINRELFGWAFENLIKNAIDAIENRVGIVQVVTRKWDDQFVEVLVTDNGKGIDPRYHKRVFDPGYSTKKRGWGLGLTLVRRILQEYHRGRIAIVESGPDIGTTFQILLLVDN